jgi:hypothetical protein
MRRTLDTYQAAAGDAFDFSGCVEALTGLDQVLGRFYANAPANADPGDPEVRQFNKVQRRLGRLLIPLNFSRKAPFWHDPALTVESLPDLAPALAAPALAKDPNRRGVLRTHLTRGQNRFIWTLIEAGELVTGAIV